MYEMRTFSLVTFVGNIETYAIDVYLQAIMEECILYYEGGCIGISHRSSLVNDSGGM